MIAFLTNTKKFKLVPFLVTIIFDHSSHHFSVDLLQTSVFVIPQLSLEFEIKLLRNKIF